MNIFRSLKSRNFRLFFYGQSVSLIGTWMQKTAVCWLVYRLTNSALLLGVVSFVSLIPSLLLSPYAGSYIERHNRYRILVITQIISMIQAGALAMMILFRNYNIPGIILLSLVQGIINAFDVTCRQSMMAEMVEEKDDLPNAIALNSTMANFARIAGPALAGIILSTFGEDFCFLSNFLSYVPVLISLFMMKIVLPPVVKSERSIWMELREGFNYISGDNDLSSLLLMLTASSLFVIPFNTLMPVFAKDLFNGDAKTFSWFESAAGLGSIISAIYMANLKGGKDMVKIMITASLIFALSLILLSYAAWLPLALLFMLLSGIGMMAQTSAINTYIQTHAIPKMRARAISYYIMAYQGMIPLGSLLTGVLAHFVGPRLTVCIAGVTGTVATVVFVSYQRKKLRITNCELRNNREIIA
ncbi:putative MFS family arabinose efflux permease [Chitinophaga niastensis]|uniref:Putative MFS family arabinose efflux permease n=1 Tax=Chitinophaga niastensis TaxID=536980 RepID=A0A2P8HC93_CHINA|nr:MFS transporter [Chitinophaga niastensis]PSL43814.1 putative MFS family arabinose efflux permease [Chitinophaga niastensis]